MPIPIDYELSDVRGVLCLSAAAAAQLGRRFRCDGEVARGVAWHAREALARLQPMLAAWVVLALLYNI